MSRSQHEAALEGARAEIAALAAEFAAGAGPILEAALRRRLRALLEAQRDRLEALKPEVAAAFGGATDRALAQGIAEVQRRLADPDLWLQPLTAPGLVARPEEGWDSVVPEWIPGFLRRFTRRQVLPGLGELDDPGNRIWVALLSAAKPLDPVLVEFGLEPSDIPELGGGHFGVQPKTGPQLDPTGTLARLWGRYRILYGRLSALERDVRAP